MRKFLLPALLAVAVPAGAQQMFRCGAAYSDKPCGAGQQVIGEPAPAPRAAARAPSFVAPPDVPVTPDTEAAAKAACVARLTADVAFRDPDSVKVLGARRAGFLPLQGDPKNITRIYVLTVNARNAYGAYSGAEDYICHTVPGSERTVLLVRPSLK